MPSRKLIAGALSLAVSLAVAWLVLGRLTREPPTVVVVDTSEDIARRMDERRATLGELADPEPDGYPPPLVREPLDEETAATFFPSVKAKYWTYDPFCYTRRIRDQPPYFRAFGEHPDGGWTLSTNDHAMREDQDVLAVRPDLRVLVTGDSHTDGLCAHSESFPNVLEALLAKELPGRVVESLNAGVGTHNLYNYLGTFERLAALAPDVFVVAVYGGNDFSGAMALQRYFHRRPAPRSGPHRWKPLRLDEGQASLGPQEVLQEVYFLNNPEDVATAVDVACSISVELQRRCAEAGSELLLVYLPPPSRGQPKRFEGELREVTRTTGLKGVELGASERIADPWLRFLDERGIRSVDLRPYFRAAEEELYWTTDHHLNVAGHRLVAEVLLEPVRDLAGR